MNRLNTLSATLCKLSLALACAFAATASLSSAHAQNGDYASQINLTTGSSMDAYDASGNRIQVTCSAGANHGNGNRGGFRNDFRNTIPSVSPRQNYLNMNDFQLVDKAIRGIGNCRLIDNRLNAHTNRRFSTRYNCDFYFEISDVRYGSNYSSYSGCVDAFWPFDRLENVRSAAAHIRNAISMGACGL